MKTVGIIAEFNPFHNGHEYIIRAAKEITGADYCVIVMSGDFVQRGEPAICDKYLRTRMALASGADAVFELPVAFSCASAEQFAGGAILLLSGLGCVDNVCFGSESGSTDAIMAIAEILADEPGNYKQTLSECIRSGMSFPAARQKAVEEYLRSSSQINNGGTLSDSNGLDEAVRAGLISSPNNILAIEYCKAYIRLRRRGIAAPHPVTVRRSGSLYGSSTPDTVKDASALALREMLKSGPAESLKPFVPSYSHALLAEAYNRTFPVYPGDFDSMLYAKLLDLNEEAASGKNPAYPSVPSEMLNALLKLVDEPLGFCELAERLKTRNYTYTAISRALISVLLGMSPAVTPDPNGNIPYARLLGIREQSSELIRVINKNASCEVINKLADAKTDSPLLSLDVKASRLYNQVIYKKFGTRLPDEYRKTIEIY